MEAIPGRRKRPLRDAATVGGDIRGRSGGDGSEVLELDTKAERFFELMGSIRDMKESWARARVGRNTNNAPVPPPQPVWTPRFCWADFAPAATSAATGQVSHAVAAAAAGHEEDQGDAEAIITDGTHCVGSVVTLDQPKVRDVVALTGNGGGQSNRGCHMTDVAAVDHGTRGTRGLPSVQLVDRRGVIDSRVPAPGGGGGKECTNGGATCSLELKLALW